MKIKRVVTLQHPRQILYSFPNIGKALKHRRLQPDVAQRLKTLYNGGENSVECFILRKEQNYVLERGKTTLLNRCSCYSDVLVWQSLQSEFKFSAIRSLAAARIWSKGTIASGLSVVSASAGVRPFSEPCGRTKV